MDVRKWPAEDAAGPGSRPRREEVEVNMKEGRRTETGDEELEFGSKVCVCPKCGITVPHKERGKPCSTRKCPECGTVMKGELCKGG